MRSFMEFQHHNITSDKLSDQNNERFYHVKQTVENRRPSKMGDKNVIFKCKNYVPHLLFHVQIVVFRNSFFRHLNKASII
jgi:hypothetical protein